MDLLERVQAMLEEAENSMDEAIRNNQTADRHFWRGYRDAANAVKRLLEDAQ